MRIPLRKPNSWPSVHGTAPVHRGVRRASNAAVLDILATGFVKQLHELGVLTPYARLPGITGVQVFDTPPGKLIVSLNDGEAFLQERFEVPDFMTSHPTIHRKLQDLAMGGNYGVFGAALEPLAQARPDLNLKTRKYALAPIVQPIWESCGEGTGMQFIRAVISGFYLAVDTQQLPAPQVQVAAIDHFRYNLVADAMFPQIGFSIEKALKEKYKPGKPFDSAPMVHDGRKGYRICFHLTPQELQVFSAEASLEMVESFLKTGISAITQNCIEGGLTQWREKGMPKIPMYHLTTVFYPGFISIAKTGVAVAIYFGVEEREPKWLKIMNELLPIQQRMTS